MERCYFKLAEGYLNITEEALIFNRSGNWQEAADVPERTAVSRMTHWIGLLIGAVLVLIGGLLHMAHVNTAGSFMFTLGLAGVSALAMYKKVRDDFAHHFRIPFQKMRALRYTDGALTVDFLNGRLKEDHVQIPVSHEAGAAALAFFERSRA